MKVRIVCGLGIVALASMFSFGQSASNLYLGAAGVCATTEIPSVVTTHKLASAANVRTLRIAVSSIGVGNDTSPTAHFHFLKRDSRFRTTVRGDTSRIPDPGSRIPDPESGVSALPVGGCRWPRS